jgi:hypothetical protein
MLVPNRGYTNARFADGTVQRKNAMKKTIALLIFLLLPVGIRPQDQVASRQLSSTKVFAFGGTGYAGKISDGEIDFRAIYSQPHAIALGQFEDLYVNGNPEAKSYALAGIRQLAPARFEALKKSLVGSSLSVITMSGCIIEEKPLTTVAAEIDKGDYDYWIKRIRGTGVTAAPEKTRAATPPIHPPQFPAPPASGG